MSENEFSPAFSVAFDATTPGGCVWPVYYGDCNVDEDGNPECFSKLEDSGAQGDRAAFEAMAVDFLDNWTGRSLGTCPATIRPCRKDCDPPSTFWGRGPYPGWAGGSPGTYQPVLIGGQWYNIGCGCGEDACSCGSIAQLELPGPVYSIEEILIGGVPLDPNSYRVDNYDLLVRLDGGDWPTCQQMDAPTTGEGSDDTFQITYTKGRPVPMGGQVAAGILACELVKAVCRDRSCALPARIQNVTRQGVTVTLFDDFEQMGEGKTGIWLIDSWIASVMKAPRRARVYSPDITAPKYRKTTWTAAHGPLGAR